MSTESQSESKPGTEQPGTIAPWACPECSGTIWETSSGPFLHFRCRVGHAYSAESFLEEHSDSIERTLWAAIRLLEERAALAEHLAAKAAQEGDPKDQQRFLADAERHRRKVASVRAAIEA